MQASQMQFSQVINAGNANQHCHIPKYQRPYSWAQENWDKIFSDIQDNGAGHFIGSIICMFDASTAQPSTDKINEIIDGQQRMTTLSLLLAAVHCRMQKIINDSISVWDQNDVDDHKNTQRNIANQLVRKLKQNDNKNQKGVHKSKKFDFILRLQPSTQNLNLDDYKFILQECGVLEGLQKPSNFGNRRMAKAYYYFSGQISDFNINEIEELAEKINQLNLVHIQVSSSSDAFRLFETLNNRGVPLSAIDIIKNKMLSEMERKHQQSIDTSYDKWQEIIFNIEGYEDRFLRQYYNAFKHEPLVQVEKISRATSSVLIKIYETLIARNPEELFEDLMIKSNLYKKIMDPDQSKELGEKIKELDYINTVPMYTLLMYILSLPKNHFPEDAAKEKIKILEFIQKYAVRRNLTDMPGTRVLDQLNIDAIEECEKNIKNGEKITANIISDVFIKSRHRPANLKELEDKLDDSYFYFNSMSRYLLIKLDSMQNSKEYKPDLWERNGKNYVWTIEHVFPQGDKIPDDWVKMIVGKKPSEKIDAQDLKDSQDFHTTWAHALGNLTLSAYNSNLSNSGFEKKQSKAEVKSGGQTVKIGYENGLAINKLSFNINCQNGQENSLSNVKKWTEAEVKARHEKMLGILLDYYKFDSER